MRKIFTILFSVSVLTGAMAQDDANYEPNCYQKYTKYFDERGAEDVEDGLHQNVVITVRRGIEADCYMGRVRVKDGKVMQIERMLEGDTYEEFERDYKHQFYPTIVQGISKTRITTDEELINVIFIKKLKPKKKGYVKAPEPDFD